MRYARLSVSFRCVLLITLANTALVYSADLKSAPVVISAKKLIFLDFYNEANDANLQFLSNSFGDGAHAAIENQYRYQRVASDTWKKYAAEKKWEPKDFFDVKKIRTMGRDLGADGVIYGKYVAGKDDLEIHGLIFSVIDGEVIGEERGKAKQDSTMFGTINEVSGRLAVKIKDLFVPSDRGALWRSALLPGWGHFYKERRDWGYFWSIAAGTALAYTLTATTVFLVYRNRYQSSSPEAYRNAAGHVGLYDEAAAQAEFDRLESATNQWATMALAGLVTTVVVYGASLLHAWLIKADLGNVTAGATTVFKMQIQVDNAYAGGISARLGYEHRWD